MQKLDPVGERIVVRRITQEQRGGILLPEVAKRGSLVGQIVAKGPDATWVEVGDIVLFGRFAGFNLPVDGAYIGQEYSECILMNCEDVLSRIVPAESEVPSAA